MSTENEEMPIRLNKRGDTRGVNEGARRGWKNTENHKWQKGHSGNPAGKPKSRVPDLLKEYLGKSKGEKVQGLNRVEIDEIEMAVLSLSNKELTELVKGDKVPMYMKGLALAALHDAKNGRTKTIDLLRDRQFGAVKKQFDVTTNGESMGQTTFTQQEAKEFLRKIEENY